MEYEPEHSLTTEELADLLDRGQWENKLSGAVVGDADISGYDGHVALALDTGLLQDVYSIHDLLTSSHHLFDVPALDVPSDATDAVSA